MAKIRVNNLDLKKIQNSIRKDITKKLRSKEVRKGIGEIIVSNIQDSPVSNSGKATKAWRRYLEPVNQPLDRKYDRNKINFTFTGRLMKDLMSNVKLSLSKGKFGYVIEHSDKRHPKLKLPKRKRKLKKSRKTQKSFTFKQLYEQIVSINPKKYDYLVFSEKSKKELVKFIRDNIFESLKKSRN